MLEWWAQQTVCSCLLSMRHQHFNKCFWKQKTLNIQKSEPTGVNGVGAFGCIHHPDIFIKASSQKTSNSSTASLGQLSHIDYKFRHKGRRYINWVECPFFSLLPNTLHEDYLPGAKLCMDLTFQVPSNIAFYSIGPCFYHQSHPQLGIVFALAPSLHSFWSYFSTHLQ